LKRSFETPISQMLETYRLNPETGRIFWRIFKNGKIPGDEAFKSKRKNGSLFGRLPCKKHVAAAVVSFALHHGRWPQAVVCHLNGDITDNRPFNLAEVDKQGQYRRSVRADSQSGITGVAPVGSNWRARITLDGKLTSLGTFDTEEQAVQAVRLAKARKRAGGATYSPIRAV